MTSTKLSKTVPLASIGLDWPGVKLAVTQTGFQDESVNCASYGFNLGTHVGDLLADVKARRAAVETHMGAPVVWLNQVHGCDVFNVDKFAVESIADTSPPSADALLSTHGHASLAIMTADCLPVVFAAFDTQGQALGVAAAHAGWRGLHAGVLQASVIALSKASQVPTHQIKAWLGPAIGPKSFEVGQEIYAAFVQQNTLNAACFQQGFSADKYFADIYALARIALSGAGVREITGGGFDTLTDSRWFSHRRGQQQGGPSGRFATLVRLLPLPGV